MYINKVFLSTLLMCMVFMFSCQLKAAEQPELSATVEFSTPFDEQFIKEKSLRGALDVMEEALKDKNGSEKLAILHHFITLTETGRTINSDPKYLIEFLKKQVAEAQRQLEHEHLVDEMRSMPLEQLYTLFIKTENLEDAVTIVEIAQNKADSVEQKKALLTKFIELANTSKQLSFLTPALPIVLTSEIKRLEDGKPMYEEVKYDLSRYPVQGAKRVEAFMKLLEEAGLGVFTNRADVFVDLPNLPTGMERAHYYGEARWRDSSPQECVLLYKIHLMPKDKDFVRTTLTLFNEIKNNPALNKAISSIKFKPVLEVDLFEDLKTGGLWQGAAYELPKIVIYVNGGKADAQIVLDAIYGIFKDQHGVERAPRFNEKVTDLIYFAQGNGDDKIRYSDRGRENPYEKPDMVYFKADVTGKVEDYHLINPNKGLK